MKVFIIIFLKTFDKCMKKYGKNYKIFRKFVYYLICEVIKFSEYLDRNGQINVRQLLREF